MSLKVVFSSCCYRPVTKESEWVSFDGNVFMIRTEEGLFFQEMNIRRDHLCLLYPLPLNGCLWYLSPHTWESCGNPPAHLLGEMKTLSLSVVLQIVIPFFSLLIKDIYFLNEGCANRLQNGHINFEVNWVLNSPEGVSSLRQTTSLFTTHGDGFGVIYFHFPKEC